MTYLLDLRNIYVWHIKNFHRFIIGLLIVKGWESFMMSIFILFWGCQSMTCEAVRANTISFSSKFTCFYLLNITSCVINAWDWLRCCIIMSMCYGFAKWAPFRGHYCLCMCLCCTDGTGASRGSVLALLVGFSFWPWLLQNACSISLAYLPPLLLWSSSIVSNEYTVVVMIVWVIVKQGQSSCASVLSWLVFTKTLVFFCWTVT